MAGFGFRVWVFTKKLPAETANNWFWRKLASHCKQAQQDCSLLVNIAGREILKPTLFKIIYPIYMGLDLGFGGFTRKLPAETANNRF